MNIDKIIKEEVRILNEVSLDVNKLGYALADVESYGGDYTATNPKSSAAGKYQFLWNTWGKEIERVTGVSTKQEFLDSPQAQEKFFKYYVNTELKPQVATLKRDSTKSDAALAALVHFQGPTGARRYLKTGAETAAEINMPVEKYLDRVEKSYYGSKQTTDTEEEVETIDVATADDEKLIDTIQNWLDIAGFIPFIGDAIDVVNGLIYFIRGQYVNAALSMIALIPGIGSAVAVPLRVAWKSAKRVFKPSVIAAISRGGPGMSKLLLNLVQEGKISPNTLKGLADAGDDVAKLIQDTSKTLADIPGAKDISKRTDAFGDYIKSLFKEVDDAAELAAKAAAEQTQLLKALKTNKAVKIVTDLVVAPITIPLNIIKRLIGKKTFRGFTDPTALTAMQSRLNKKYVDRLFKGQGMDAILKRIDLSDIQSENILNFMRRSDISLGGLSKADMLRLTPSQFKKYYKGAGIQNLPANQRKSLLSHITNNSGTFPEFNKYFKGYKKQFIEREMSKLRNLSATTGSKKFLINKADNLFSNVNVPKGFAKMYTVGELLEDTNNPMLQDLGEAIRALSYDTYEFFKITSIAEPGNEQDQKDIINQQEKVNDAIKEVEKAQLLVRNIDPDSLTEEDKEILYLLTQVEKAYGLK
jgi:hypothetical protein